MIVRQFLQWVRKASAAERADATGALARAYLHSDLSSDDRAAAEGALLILLDDPSPMIRRTLAEALAASAKAPPAVIHALAGDQVDIAAPIYQHSPLLTEADLVDAVGGGEPLIQVSIARRASVPRSVAAAMSEVGSAEACLTMLENEGARLAQFSLDRLVARHGHLGAIREVLLERDDLPAATRQALVAKLSETLAGFVVSREWLRPDRAQRVAREACEKATVTLAADSAEHELGALTRRLRESGQLTAGLVLRSLLSGNVALFEETLAELSGMPLDRVCGLIYARNGAGLRAVYNKAELPETIFPAFREALEALRETGFVSNQAGASQLKRRMVERVLTRCETETSADIEPLLMLLRRFAAEAAREEARHFCNELVSDEGVQPPLEGRLVA